MELVTIVNYAFGKHNLELAIFKLASQHLSANQQKSQVFSFSLSLSLSDELWVETVLMVWVQGNVNHSNRKVFHF